MLKISIHSPTHSESNQNLLSCILLLLIMASQKRLIYHLSSSLFFFMPDSQINNDLKQEIMDSINPDRPFIQTYLNPLNAIYTTDKNKGGTFEFQSISIDGYYLKIKSLSC